MSVLSRILIGCAAAAVVVTGWPGVAGAQPSPEPPPAPPDVNAFTPVNPMDFAEADGSWYAFSVPGGVTCVLQRNGGYGCNGPLPNAPNGANLVSGGLSGPPGFSTTDRPVFGMVADAKPLPAGSRISFQTISCGTDGVMTACVNARDQSGFVISPGATYLVGTTNPLLDRPDGNRPF